MCSPCFVSHARHSNALHVPRRRRRRQLGPLDGPTSAKLAPASALYLRPLAEKPQAERTFSPESLNFAPARAPAGPLGRRVSSLCSRTHKLICFVSSPFHRSPASASSPRLASPKARPAITALKLRLVQATGARAPHCRLYTAAAWLAGRPADRAETWSQAGARGNLKRESGARGQGLAGTRSLSRCSAHGRSQAGTWKCVAQGARK